MSDFEIPRCSHGEILLGCAVDDCEEQNAYLAGIQMALERYEQQQQEAARIAVREALGLTP